MLFPIYPETPVIKMSDISDEAFPMIY